MPAVGPFTAVSLFVATLYAAQSLVRYAKAKDMNGVLAIVLAAASGIAVVALAAHSNMSSDLQLIQGGAHLGKLDMASQVMLGIAVGSAGTVVADFRKAFDGTTTAAKPLLVAKKAAAPPAEAAPAAPPAETPVG